MRDESVKEGREAHEGLWSQAKDLSSQRGSRRVWGRAVIQSDLSVLPKMIKWVRAKQVVQELSWMCHTGPHLQPQRLCPPTRKSRCFVCSLGTRTMARRENTEGERKLDGIQSH